MTFDGEANTITNDVNAFIGDLVAADLIAAVV